MDNINLILNALKNNKQNNIQEEKKGSLLKVNSLNSNNIKTILPLITEDSENMYKMLSCLEVNQLVNNYKATYQTIEKDKILDLKKEAVTYIRRNLNEDNKYMADLIIKVLEIKEIMNRNYKRGVNNGL